MSETAELTDLARALEGRDDAGEERTGPSRGDATCEPERGLGRTRLSWVKPIRRGNPIRVIRAAPEVLHEHRGFSILLADFLRRLLPGGAIEPAPGLGPASRRRFVSTTRHRVGRVTLSRRRARPQRRPIGLAKQRVDASPGDGRFPGTARAVPGCALSRAREPEMIFTAPSNGRSTDERPLSTSGPEPTPGPRLTMTGLRKLRLPRLPGPLSRASSKRLARTLYGPAPEGAAQDARGNVLEFLRKVPLFEGLGRMELQQLARIVHEREYGDGEFISREGRPGAALFILRRGLVEVTRRDRDGADVTLATLEAPASFDEEAAIGAETIRWFSARAHGPVSVLALGKADMGALSESYPAGANRVLMRLAGIMAARFQTFLGVLLVTEALDAEEHEESKP